VSVWVCSACEKHSAEVDLRGSWYFDVGDWGPIDTTINYTELYFSDSSFYGQDEVMGQGHKRLYMVTPDSIYYGDDSTNLKPFYKILGLKKDTLWLKANPKILNKLDTVFYVRFPKDEFGHYDLTWTSENRDSLRMKVPFDYNRRMWKYHAFRNGAIKTYDSLERAGHWKWSMNEIRE
jgi:hypothetical protein